MNDFLKKFQGRFESLGKDGVEGLMKNISNLSPITSNSKYSSSNSIQPNSILTYDPCPISQPYTYKYNIENNETKNTNNGSNSSKQLLSNAGLVLSNQIWYNNLNSKGSPYVKKNATWMGEYDEHYNRIRDVDYKPYTIKDYKKICEQPVKMGKLGANLGTKEWNEKKEKMNRLMEYSKQVNDRQKRLGNKQKMLNVNQQVLTENNKRIFGSNRFKCVEYGKGLKKRILEKGCVNLGNNKQEDEGYCKEENYIRNENYGKEFNINMVNDNNFCINNNNDGREVNYKNRNNYIDNMYLQNINMLRNSLIN